MDPFLIAIIGFGGNVTLKAVPEIFKKNDSVSSQSKLCFEKSMEKWSPNIGARDSERKKIHAGIEKLLNNKGEFTKTIEVDSDLQSFYLVYEKEVARPQYHSLFSYYKNKKNQTDFKILQEKLSEISNELKEDNFSKSSLLNTGINQLNESYRNHLYKEVIKISDNIVSNYGENLNPKEFYSIYIKRSKCFLNISMFNKTEFYIKKAFVSLKQAERIYRKNNFIDDSEYKLQLADAYINLSNVRSANENLKKASDLLLEISEIITSEKEPSKFSNLSFYKGKYYLAKSEHSNDTELDALSAIDSFNIALNNWTENRYPFKHAVSKINIGNAYCLLMRTRNRENNFKKALLYYQDAIDFFSIEKSDFHYAQIQMNMGYAYSFISEAIDTNDNLNKAKKCLDEAKRIYSDAKKSIHWARVNLNLSNTYNFLAQNTQNESFCKEAIRSAKKALSVYKPTKFPKLNAKAFGNIGSSYWILSQIESSRALIAQHKNKIAKRKSHVEKSKKFIFNGFKEMEIALSVCKEDNYPIEYGAIMNNMGLLFRELAKYQDSKENLDKSIKYYQNSVEIRTYKSYPFDYAQTLINLGNAQKELSRITENQDMDINASLTTYKEALVFYKSKKYDNGHGLVAHNLGEAYRIKFGFSNVCTDLTRALKLQKESLKIFNKKKYPYHHNTILNEIQTVKSLIKSNCIDTNV